MMLPDWSVPLFVLSASLAAIGGLFLVLNAYIGGRSMFEVYRDAAGGYRWRLRAPNGRIMADSGESYTRLRDAKRAVRKLAWSALRARVAVK